MACFIQIIIHEFVHLIFDLVSGYKFNSFRIFNYMIVKDNDKLVFKKYSVTGRIPYVLYDLGGSILNFISAIICFYIRFSWVYIWSC